MTSPRNAVGGDHFRSVAIVGVGLIGGSIGLAAKRRGLDGQVIGIGRNEDRLRRAIELGAIDRMTTELREGVSEADLVIVCTPVESIATFVRQTLQHTKPTTLVTDAGSTKETIVRLVEGQRQEGQAVFVGSHPLAGSEKTSVEYAAADLFAGRTVVVTPTDHSPPADVERLLRFWESLGSKCLTMSPAEHDQAVAATSHLPHVIAALVAASTPTESLPLVATGWLDTTRIAAGDVELWRQILAQNRGSVLKRLREFAKVLNSFTDALDGHDEEAVSRLLAAGKQQRDALAD